MRPVELAKLTVAAVKEDLTYDLPDVLQVLTVCTDDELLR
jgi:hypothetical protein